MRICLISQEYPTDDHGGGIGTYTEKTARALARLGQTVTVITEAVGEPSVSVEEGVTIHRLAKARTSHLRTLARSRAVANTLQRLTPHPDIVQACEFRAEAVWYSFRKPPQTKLVTRLATPSFAVRELNDHGVTGRGASRSQLDSLERWQTRRSNAVISISQAITDVVRARWNLPDSLVTPMKTGVDFSSRHAADAGQLPAELDGHEYLLFFGRLEERKGVHVLAQALPEILARRPSLHVALAGNALEYKGRPMDEFLRECNRDYLDRIHIFPRQTQRNLYPLLANALVVVLPSLWEGLGNVALEAIDMGKPVVTTSGSGLAEVVEDGRSGVLVPPGDVRALSSAIGGLLDDRPRLDRLAAGAKERATCFELSRVTEELIDFYEALLSRPAPAGAVRR
jgi:glycosyltransferase involved in cell wall biosynthesis